MKSTYSFIVAVGALCVLAACSKSVEKKPTLIVMNVLSPELYADAHIKGSISVPFEQAEQYAKTLDPKTEVVVYCSNYMCSASGMVAQTLLGMGFTKVWAFEGGMAEWYQLGYPTEGPVAKELWRAQNNKPNVEHTIPVITAQELKEKMTQHNVL
jgi:rhodanese-related sulfurtransferase